MASNLLRPTSELPISFDNPPTEITRQQAAENQLDRAIWLWFGDNASDWPSIHTLTVAAQGVLAAACRGANLPQSKLVTSLKSKPRGFQDAMLSPQNFFKHGYHKQKKRKPDLLGYAPEVIEVYVMDNIETYNRLFKARDEADGVFYASILVRSSSYGFGETDQGNTCEKPRGRGLREG